MSLLLLQSDVILLFLSYLTITNICNFDNAICNRGCRPLFLECLQHNGFKLHGI